jgi:hypothetical protein
MKRRTLAYVVVSSHPSVEFTYLLLDVEGNEAPPLLLLIVLL